MYLGTNNTQQCAHNSNPPLMSSQSALLIGTKSNQADNFLAFLRPMGMRNELVRSCKDGYWGCFVSQNPANSLGVNTAS